jgi:hypothetical protein
MGPEAMITGIYASDAEYVVNNTKLESGIL